MIESLHIEDLGVIEEADLPLSRGLTALTGETGAGKTMVLTSLGLLLGQRAETTIVRTGAERSLVEGAFLVDPDSRVAARVVEAGGDLDDDLLLASRTVPASGRSRAYLGGRSVPASVLSEVAGWSPSTARQTSCDCARPRPNALPWTHWVARITPPCAAAMPGPTRRADRPTRSSRSGRHRLRPEPSRSPSCAPGSRPWRRLIPAAVRTGS